MYNMKTGNVSLETREEDSFLSIFETLPDEMIVRILEYCDGRTLFSLKQTCRFFYTAAKELSIKGSSLSELKEIIRWRNVYTLKESINYHFLSELLIESIKLKRVDMVKALLDHHPLIDGKIVTILAQYGNRPIYEAILPHLTRSQKKTSLLLTISANNDEVISYLIDSGVRPRAFLICKHIYSYLIKRLQNKNEPPINSELVRMALNEPRNSGESNNITVTEIKLIISLVSVIMGKTPISALYNTKTLWEILTSSDPYNIHTLVKVLGPNKLIALIEKEPVNFGIYHFVTRQIFRAACSLGEYTLISKLSEFIRKGVKLEGLNILIQNKHLDLAFALMEELIAKGIITTKIALTIACKNGSLSLAKLIESSYKCKRNNLFRSCSTNFFMLEWVSKGGTGFITMAFTRACGSKDRKGMLFLLYLILMEKVPWSIKLSSEVHYPIINQINYYQFGPPITALPIIKCNSSDRKLIFIKSNKLNSTKSLQAVCSINDIDMAKFLKDVYGCDPLPSLKRDVKSVEMTTLLLRDTLKIAPIKDVNDKSNWIRDASDETKPLILRALLTIDPPLAIKLSRSYQRSIFLMDDDILLKKLLEIDTSLNKVDLLYDSIINTSIRIVRYLVSTPIEEPIDKWEECVMKLNGYDWAKAINDREEFIVRFEFISKYILSSTHVPLLFQNNISDRRDVIS